MKQSLVPLLLMMAVSMPQAADLPLQITASEWAQPRSGAELLRDPVLAESVRQLQAKPGSTIEILYPGGDSGALWARELQAWLVALGIDSSRIRALPGSEAADLLQLRIR